ncbi:MAG: HK97 gp10 family phage protein [Ruminococcus flavefaciens]|nr:HK97 gp10 family phage protein [Ruminococcus flavefaciens]
MATHVSIEKMEQELREILQDYQDLTDEEVETAVRKTANTVKKIIKSEAPEDTGEYEKSWTSRKTTKKRRKVVYTVYSKNRGRLAHLLEDGHKMVTHDKVVIGEVKGKEHIKPAVENAEKELMYQIGKIYRGRK